MKQEHILKAEQEARAACEGLGYTEKQIQDFIDMHIEGEYRRANEKAKELASPKRGMLLNKVLSDITRSQDRNYHEDTPVVSRGFDAEQERDAATYQRQRNRGET